MYTVPIWHWFLSGQITIIPINPNCLDMFGPIECFGPLKTYFIDKFELKLILGGDFFLSPIWKLCNRQIGSSPQISGRKYEIFETTTY